MAADKVEAGVRELGAQALEGPQEQRAVLALPLNADEQEAWARPVAVATSRPVVGA
jgi:hypothetical protein